MHKRIAQSHGFTLIELLVVMAIISLLVAVLLPALSAARVRAQQIRCTAQIHNASLAFLMYFNDSKEFFPPLAGSWGYNYGTWLTPVRNYVSNKNATAFQCPPSNPGSYYAPNWRLRFVTWGDTGTSYRLADLKNLGDTGLLLENAQYADCIYWMRASACVDGTYGNQYVRHDRRGISVSYLDGHGEFSAVQKPVFVAAEWTRSLKWVYRKFWGQRNDGAYLSVYYIFP